MDLALTINGWIDEDVIFAQQLGARQVFAQVDNSQGTSPGWDRQSLARLANRIEKAGLVLAGLHATGTPPRGERLEETPADAVAFHAAAWVVHLAQEAGAARIGFLSLSAALFTERRSAENSITARLAPLAEAAAQAGVKLAIPLAPLLKEYPGGQSQGHPITPERLLHSLPPSAGLDGSPGLLLDWLQNTAPGSNPRQMIQDRLCLVSFEHERRPGSRSGGKLNGAGFDELLSVCWCLRQAGFAGLIRLGRPAQWKGDTREGHQARAFTTGYLRAVLQAFQSGHAPLRAGEGTPAA